VIAAIGDVRHKISEIHASPFSEPLSPAEKGDFCQARVVIASLPRTKPGIRLGS
jgi:hypothetical protein